MILRLLFQTVLIALRQILANKVRAMLTCLGIIIGVAAVVTTVAGVRGLQRSVLSEFETFGTKKVYIDGFLPRHLRGRVPWHTMELKMHEVHHIITHASSLRRFTPLFFGSYPVEHGTEKLDAVQTVGIWPDWHEIENRFVTSGRRFNTVDEEQRLNVCLINDKAIELLGLDREPAGTPIHIGGRRFMVVGVVETKDIGAMFGGGQEATAEIYIPLSVARSMQPERRHVNFLLGELRNADLAGEAQAEIAFMLRRLRGIKPGEDDTFEIRVLQAVIDQFNRVAGIITVVSFGVVAISLLVGGIGIMNIMLVSVSERTREIGLRKALGARPEVILTQFLIEAVTFCLVGGAIGLALGYGLVFAARVGVPDAMQHAEIPLWASGIAVGFSACTGVLFGMFPALKAARLNPIDALRHE